MRLKASDTGGIWPYEKRLTPRYFIPPQSGPMGVLKRLLKQFFGEFTLHDFIHPLSVIAFDIICYRFLNTF